MFIFLFCFVVVVVDLLSFFFSCPLLFSLFSNSSCLPGTKKFKFKNLKKKKKRYTCTVYAPGYVIFCVILALVPQIIIALKLQPMLVKNYCYMAAITMGIDKPDDEHHHGGESHPHGGGGGGNKHDEHHHHGHKRFDEHEFSHILEQVFEKMAEDEANSHMFRTLINSAIRRRAIQRKNDIFMEELNIIEGSELDDLLELTDCTHPMYLKEVALMFEEFDSGSGQGAEAGDGVLSYSELRNGLGKLFAEANKPHLSKSKFKRLTRILDEDRGGEIDEDEFTAFLVDEHWTWAAEANKQVQSINDKEGENGAEGDGEE